ncbi:MAG: hypothetical protein NWQ23_02985 [Yoonia sp.]|uniref:TadE/TadG family type IV pilus assembly protein n=1 Tax=Yoonia sp. TaxID=2212373 RepID=UPI00273D3EC8|nr:hypothetical protein [Yoonia sp.]MDP5084359.1 hypothetical protein [Yoonia sp.]
MYSITSYLKKFRDCEEGTVAVELVLMVPILMWVFLSTFVYFDAFRVETNAARATITITEMLSREEASITQEYLDSVGAVLQTLTFADAQPDFRVTVYQYRQVDDTFRVVWSRHTGMGDVLDDNDLAQLHANNRLPLISATDHNVLVETQIEYSAPFSFNLSSFSASNLDDVTFTNSMIIRPRPGRLCFDPSPAPSDDICVAT